MKSRDRKKKEAVVINKEETAENWCFVCKDGGDLRICDHKACLKSYHPSCVEKDEEFLESETHWDCAWHTCFSCHRCSYIQCYTCTKAICRNCLPGAEFFRIKGQYGFCDSCLKMALLIEDGKDYDSDGNKVDFRDRETVEGLYSEYYYIVKEEKGFEAGDLYAAKDKGKTKRKVESSSEADDEEEDEVSDYDGVEHVKKCRRTCNGRRSGGQKSGMRASVISIKNDFTGWGSRSLIDFLSSIGKSTDKALSQDDVASMVNKYVTENKLLNPEKKKMILCDERLRSLFRRRTFSKHRVHELLEAHFAENYESEEDEEQYDSEEDTAGIVDVRKRQKMLDMEKESPEKELEEDDNAGIPDVRLGRFAAIVVENVKLVFLRRSLLLYLLKQPESFAEKVVGCFVRIKSDPYDYHSRNSHQLIPVRGVGRVSIDQNNMEAILQISAMPKEISTSQISDDDFSKEECEDLRRKVSAGQLERPTVEDLQQKANILHVDITNHWIKKELGLLQNLIDRANEKGWRREFFEYQDKKKRLQNPLEVSKMLKNVPKVIPDLDDLHPNSEDIVNDMSCEKNSPKSILRCNSPITNDGWQDDKESEEKTRNCSPSPLARKQLNFEGPNFETGDENITRKAPLPTAELNNNTPEEEELEMCSQETRHNQETRSGHKAPKTAVIELLSDSDDEIEDSKRGKAIEVAREEQNISELGSEVWCLKDPNGERRKYPLSVMKKWSQGNVYASKFKVWKEGENEDDAVWLRDVFPLK